MKRKNSDTENDRKAEEEIDKIYKMKRNELDFDSIENDTLMECKGHSFPAFQTHRHDLDFLFVCVCVSVRSDGSKLVFTTRTTSKV